MRNLQRLTPLALMVVLLLAAAALRIIGWIDAPPGMRYDEMTVVVEADDIRLGDRPIYMDGSAEEPLYHYLFAMTEDTIGPSLFAQRWLSAMLGVIAIAAIYALGRQMFTARLGLITAAISVAALWALMYSRMGLRIVALPVFVLLAMLFLWRGLARSRRRDLIIAGIILGLSAYTYSATRMLPFIFVSFFLYLLLFNRSAWQRHGFNLGLTLIIGLIIAAPLAIHIASVPQAERRLGEVEGPLDALKRGEIRPLINSALITSGMFIATGDPETLYNIPNRPVFDLLTGVIFYIGVVWCARPLIKRRKAQRLEGQAEADGISSQSKGAVNSNNVSLQPARPSMAIDVAKSATSIAVQDAYAFLLIWLFFGLVPPMLTWPAASNSHGILAQMPAFLILAIGLNAVAEKLPKIMGRTSRGSIAVIGLVLAIHSLHSISDYFGTWSNLPTVRTEYAADLTSTAHYLAKNPVTSPLVFSSGDVTHFNPWSATAFRLITPIGYTNARWFDARSSFIFPQGATDLTLINSANDTAPAQLDSRLIEDLFPVVEPSPLASMYFSATHLVSQLNTRLMTLTQSSVALPLDAKSTQLISLPIAFGDHLDLIGYEVRKSIVQPGKNIRLTTYWRAKNIGLRPLSTFTHVLNDRGEIAAQWDGLTIDQHYIQAGDIIVQVHFIALPPNFPEGLYRLQLGLYDLESGARVPIEIEGQAITDRILLQSITVQK